VEGQTLFPHEQPALAMRLASSLVPALCEAQPPYYEQMGSMVPGHCHLPSPGWVALAYGPRALSAKPRLLASPPTPAMRGDPRRPMRLRPWHCSRRHTPSAGPQARNQVQDRQPDHIAPIALYRFHQPCPPALDHVAPCTPPRLSTRDVGLEFLVGEIPPKADFSGDGKLF
jgi:hypothetical protein